VLNNNINTPNNHLTPQLTEQSPHTSTHWTITSHLNSLNNYLTPQLTEQLLLTPKIIENKGLRNMTIEMEVMAWNRHTGKSVKPVNAETCNGNNNFKKTCTYTLPQTQTDRTQSEQQHKQCHYYSTVSECLSEVSPLLSRNNTIAATKIIPPSYIC
jgi:hypothetical protein